jgi:hypothetical protein
METTVALAPIRAELGIEEASTGNCKYGAGQMWDGQDCGKGSRETKLREGD